MKFALFETGIMQLFSKCSLYPATLSVIWIRVVHSARKRLLQSTSVHRLGFIHLYSIVGDRMIVGLGLYKYNR